MTDTNIARPVTDIDPAAQTEHPGSATLIVHALCKSFEGERRGLRKRTRASTKDRDDRVNAVEGVNFSVEPGELFTLLGPSGCGKTTTLRSIAGLERPDSGAISLNDRPLFDGSRRINVPTHARQLGMVFQSYAIWPHMSVFQNVALPLQITSRRHRLRRREIYERVSSLLDMTELAGMAQRPATKLSGGQQQRLALARALVTNPQLILLDEPLSNLDAKLRESMRFELKRLQRELGLTVLYVTHDQVEALSLSTRIAVMNAGKIVQIGKPREIYQYPSSVFVAEFIGVSNLFHGVITNEEKSCYKIETDEGSLWAAAQHSRLTLGTHVTASVRPECIHLSVAQPRDAPPNEWLGRVRTRAFLGDSVDHIVVVGERELRSRSNPAQSIAPDTDVYLTVDPTTIALVERAPGEATASATR